MSEIIRYIDTIARDKEIDKEALCEAVEQSMAQALSKKYGVDDLVVTLDRVTGALECNYDVDFENEGRITAQSVKQAIISKVREQERDVLYGEFETKIGEIVTDRIQVRLANAWPGNKHVYFSKVRRWPGSTRNLT